MRAVRYFKNHIITFSAVILLILIFTNTVIVIYNNKVLAETTKAEAQAQRAKELTAGLWSDVVKNLDLGLRGYALVKNEQMLNPFNMAAAQKETYIRDLDSVLKAQKFPYPNAMREINTGVEKFMGDQQLMLHLIKKDSLTEFKRIMVEDRGYALWKIYERNSKLIIDFEDKIEKDAVEGYKAANQRTVITQILLFIIGLPTLFIVLLKITRDRKHRHQLFFDLEKNNREHLFNPGDAIEISNEQQLIQNSIKNYKNAKDFINQITEGNLDVEWEQINEKNRDLNVSNLTGALIKMREKMKSIKSEDDKRSWTTEGLAKFSEVIRVYQNDLNTLSYEVLVFITKYLDAQQGAIYILREDEEGKEYLDLEACYAFNKKKHVTKKIELGQGMVGQTFLEKTTILLTEIPAGYTEITSGLGEATPDTLLIVPMKYSDKVEAVIELASFHKYEDYHIQFVEKLGDIVASTLGTVKNNDKTKLLLEQFKIQTEQLREQEEELRQNIEEMEATQEALKKGVS